MRLGAGLLRWTSFGVEKVPTTGDETIEGEFMAEVLVFALLLFRLASDLGAYFVSEDMSWPYLFLPVPLVAAAVRPLFFGGSRFGVLCGLVPTPRVEPIFPP